MKVEVVIKRQYNVVLEAEEAQRIKALASYVQSEDLEQALQRSRKKGTPEGNAMVSDVLTLLKTIGEEVTSG